MLDILALSGSLRAASLNAALLKAAIALAPDGMTIELYDGLGALPLFNPDLDPAMQPAAMAFIARAAKADALLIACPEYARGIPGAFKNALDWLVGSAEFGGKKVALFNASGRATDAQAALRLVLSTMAVEIVEKASVTLPLPGPDWTPAANYCRCRSQGPLAQRADGTGGGRRPLEPARLSFASSAATG